MDEDTELIEMRELDMDIEAGMRAEEQAFGDRYDGDHADHTDDEKDKDEHDSNESGSVQERERKGSIDNDDVSQSSSVRTMAMATIGAVTRSALALRGESKRAYGPPPSQSQTHTDYDENEHDPEAALDDREKEALAHLQSMEGAQLERHLQLAREEDERERARDRERARLVANAAGVELSPT